MNKILAITSKELYTTFTDRNLLILMIAAPLTIATIVALVFSGFGSDGSGLTFSDIPVAVVNLDEGTAQQGQPTNYGAILAGFLVPGSDSGSTGAFSQGECSLAEANRAAAGSSGLSLDDLLDAQRVDDAAAARAGVENGDYAVMVVIPPDFSARLAPNVNPIAGPVEPAVVEVYANSGQPVEGTIVRSIVEGFTNRLLTGNIAIGASISTLIQQNPAAALRLTTAQNDPQLNGVFACGFTDMLATVSLDAQSVQAEEQPRGVATAILVQTGSAQAVLFALFAGQFGVMSIINERRAGTLQRMLVTPTPRSVIIAGKLFSTFAMVVFQLLILLAALTLIASLVEGRLTLIWGSHFLALAAVILMLALAVAGFGVLLMGLAKTPEQVGPVGAILNIVMGAVGGAFGFAPVFPLAYVSLIYWGTDAFNKLSLGNSDILPNVLALLVGGTVLLVVGLFLFNRRVEI